VNAAVRHVDCVQVRPCAGWLLTTASVAPWGENRIALGEIEPGNRTGVPLGVQLRMSSKRTTPAESPVASSRPSGATAREVISLRDGRISRIAAGFFWSVASRSLRVSTRS
jgi:hypothetical protein